MSSILEKQRIAKNKYRLMEIPDTKTTGAHIAKEASRDTPIDNDITAYDITAYDREQFFYVEVD